MRKLFILCLFLLITILMRNEAGRKRGRQEISGNTDENIGNFCRKENPLKQNRRKARKITGEAAINKLVAAFLSDPECEGQNIFAANQSGPGNISYAKLDFNALINSDCIAIERHNMFYSLSDFQTIGTHYKNYCSSKIANRPVNSCRKKLLKAIKAWAGVDSIAKIPDICVKLASKFRLLRLERARNAGTQCGAGNSDASSSTVGTSAPAPFNGNNRCVEEDPAECAAKSYLCTENDYKAPMGEKCPIACRYCRAGETYHYDYAKWNVWMCGPY